MNTNYNGIFTSLDLEMAQPSGKIISIGYAIGNIETGEILASDDLFVKIDEPLTSFIIQLTGITDDLLNEKGIDLLTAYNKLKDKHLEHKSFINAVTWGGGDTQAIADQLKTSGQQFKWCFGRRWIDVKTVYVSRQMALKKDFKGGLAKSMLKMGLKFEGAKHRSKDDAIQTFKMYKALLNEFKVSD